MLQIQYQVENTKYQEIIYSLLPFFNKGENKSIHVLEVYTDKNVFKCLLNLISF